MLVKHYTVDFKIFFIFLFSMFFNNSGIVTAQSFVNNGSFETHKRSVYPIDLTKSTNYEESQLLKCIGFCAIQSPFIWPPVDGPSYCDEDLWGALNGWYWVSKHASPDYFSVPSVVP